MKHIVITSIFQPTEAIFKFSQNKDYKLIVIGDKKTPVDWKYENVEFISADAQSELGFGLSNALPYNHYCRKMIGYLYAIKEGSELIVDTDDDNIPKENWVFPATDGIFETIPSDLGFINIYNYYTEEKIWPRGLPLNLINNSSQIATLKREEIRVGIWQGLADEDPDVDAIYRLTSDKPCYFDDRDPIVINAGTITPFNSQNTAIVKELFPLLYLPCHVTFRFTDILRGLVAQPIMWLFGYHLGFTNATVVQKRNPHDYYKDFISEVPMYLHTEKVVDLVLGSLDATRTIEENLLNAYNSLFNAGIVTKEEINTLEIWLKDLALLKSSK